MSSPIADLSYRGYDGPLESPRFRWWSIARTMIGISLRKRIAWVFSALSAWYYLAMIFVLYVMDTIAARVGDQGAANIDRFFGRIIWKDQFLHGFSFGQMLFLFVALILGAGAMANDARANALVVYLSKPVSKADYLVGKWLGIFLPLLVIMLVPSLIFFGYAAMSYQERHFLTQDPWLFWKMLALYPLGAAFHASMVLGFSSMFKQGRVAGAVYAGLYFLTNFFTGAMGVVFAVMNSPMRHGGVAKSSALVENLYYCSIDGLCIGMAKGILGTSGSAPFGIPDKSPWVPAPSLPAVLTLMTVLSVVMLTVAWTRVKAVEVVG